MPFAWHFSKILRIFAAENEHFGSNASVDLFFGLYHRLSGHHAIRAHQFIGNRYSD
ncbi:MAG: hypothetical protein KIPDCIKN_03368 [Haliscomenobacter sp.]|nr:hypothetical protein [Haliscomenobacter sp.]